MKENNFSFLWKLFKPYSYLMLFAIFGGIIESLAMAGIVFIIKNIIDDVFIAKDLTSLKFVVTAIVVIAFFKQLGFFMRDYLYPLAIFKVVRNIRADIYNKILNAEPSFFVDNNLGDILSRITNDLEAFTKTVKLLSVNLITQIFTVVAMIIVLIYRDWQLFLIFLVSVPFLALALNYFGNKRKKYSQRLRESFAEFTQIINQILTGIEVVKLFDKKPFIALFQKINNKLYHRQKKDIFYESIYLAVVEFIGYSATAAIVFYGGYRIISGNLSTGEFFSFLGGVVILINSLQVLQRGAVQIKALNPIIDRLRFLLMIPQEEDKGIEFKGLKEKILYKDVYLKIKENQILNGINLRIKAGEKLGIVGLTGSGKSTMVKILPALIKNYQGEVFLDEHELREYRVSSLRKRIGMVSQDVFIFNDTVRNNLLIAKPDATDEEIIQALKKAKADFVFKLEKGLDTVLGEKGSRLSGGERQRLSIARIFLKRPNILIIDEGTSALDVKTEEEVINNIFSEFEKNTILMITHRLKILEKTQRIVVIDKGKIVEEGTKDELIKKKGVFYRFITISGEKFKG
ncbi:MAG: ABC transporter ATP-binding protein [Aquificae bacterium]|nr:ABC transporter ATP-binding protein [Aquificota bacterium]